MDSLSLQEQLTLLCLNDRTGRVEGQYYGYALSGLGLGDLALRGRLDLGTDPIALREPGPCGDGALDLAVAHLLVSPRPQPLDHWVRHLYPDGCARMSVLASLVRRGLVRPAEDRVLWVFRRETYPAVETSEEAACRERVRAGIAGSCALDPPLALLAAVVVAAGLLPHVVEDRNERRSAKDRVAALRAAYPLADRVAGAIARVVAADEAAAVAATAAAAIG